MKKSIYTALSLLTAIINAEAAGREAQQSLNDEKMQESHSKSLRTAEDVLLRKLLIPVHSPCDRARAMDAIKPNLENLDEASKIKFIQRLTLLVPSGEIKKQVFDERFFIDRMSISTSKKTLYGSWSGSTKYVYKERAVLRLEKLKYTAALMEFIPEDDEQSKYCELVLYFLFSNYNDNLLSLLGLLVKSDITYEVISELIEDTKYVYDDNDSDDEDFDYFSCSDDDDSGACLL